MHRIRVLYDPRQQADGNTSFSPSASKPARAVASWLGAGLPIDILSFDPAPISLLRRVHDPAYVDGVLSCGRVNGFQNRNPAVASSLPWTVGSMIAAAREALSNMRVACSPTSGFHHAERLGGGDFCTFNGLIAAVVAVLDDGFDRKVGIIDLDAHWANGTVDILAAMPDVAARVEHFNFGGDVRDRTPQGIRAWMQELPWIVDGIASRCGLVIFQAGADPHVSDPLGGFMTSAEMRERDRIVFRTCARRRVPIAWNLAGGYQEPFHRVLALHDATMEECVAAFAGQPG